MKYIVKSIIDFNEGEITHFYNEIPKLKKNKIDKLKKYENKKRSIIGELLLSKLLIKENIPYKYIEYYLNDDGKPYLNNNSLFFNISHSFDYVIAVISKNEIGVDIEKIRKTPLNTINQFATQKEKEYILSSDNDTEERIFKIYSLKESYFKMLGTNLNHVFDVEFMIDNDKVYCSDKSVKVGFINDVKGYIIAYCEKK